MQERGTIARLILILAVLSMAYGPRANATEAADQEEKSLLSTGEILVAGTGMKDPRFTGTVILLLERGRSGSAGLILNRPTPMRLGAALSGVKGFRDRTDAVFYGGPARKDRPVALVRSSRAPKRSLKVFDGVYLGAGRGFFDGLIEGIRQGDEFRVYSGFVKWDYHELDRQVSIGLWKVMDGTPELVFAREPETLWHSLVR